MKKKMALEEEQLGLNFKSQSSLSVPEVSFLNQGLESKKKYAAEITQVIFTLEGKIDSLDLRSQQVLIHFKNLLNVEIKKLVGIFKFQEETKEEIFKREQAEWRKEKGLLLQEKETALITATAAELKSISDLLEAEKVHAEDFSEVLNDLQSEY